MSGVNRNIIGNLAIPLGGGISTGPAELDLITTTGSRWVMFEFPSKFVSSSEGGLCRDLVLEWTTDPAMVTNPLASSSAYFAVTSSVISCNSASLSPMTASNAWVQYIDSEYKSDGGNAFYYMRGYQRTIAGYNPQIYSNVRSILTRLASTCGATPDSLVTNNRVIYDVDGFISGSSWFNTPQATGIQNYSSASMIASTNLTLVKAGSPNYDAIKTNGANLTVFRPSTGGTNFSMIGVAVVQGSVRIPTSQGQLFVSAVSSSVSGSVVFKNVSLQSGVNTINKIIKIGYTNSPGLEQYIFVDDQFITLIPGSQGALSLPANSTITTSADCIMRVFFAAADGGGNYSPDIYHCKYGPGGVNGYVG